ncbi:MAG: hypothetical protein PHH93_09205 [Prolixibacteraceae bacterium]|nr:hypothetical protein [Prolixibacteraceae bacterium]
MSRNKLNNFTIACPELASGVNDDNTRKEQTERSESMRYLVVKSV